MAEHGTASRYTNGKCRCDECKVAYREYRRETKRGKHEKMAAGLVPDGAFQHGKRSSYEEWGCRCEACKAAASRHVISRSMKRRQDTALGLNAGKFEHGLRGHRYWGCRCDECKTAAADRARELRDQKKDRKSEPPTHGLSGYTHWFCRCEVCRQAKADDERERTSRQRTALRAGEIPPEDFKHGASGYSNWGCRCEVCVKGAQKLRKEHAESHAEIIKTGRRKRYARAQSRTLEKAGRRYFEWTGPELELAARSDLTVEQVALMVGRTFAAVRMMREKLRDDPKTINLAGIKPSPADR